MCVCVCVLFRQQIYQSINLCARVTCPSALMSILRTSSFVRVLVYLCVYIRSHNGLHTYTHVYTPITQITHGDCARIKHLAKSVRHDPYNVQEKQPHQQNTTNLSTTSAAQPSKFDILTEINFLAENVFVGVCWNYMIDGYK